MYRIKFWALLVLFTVLCCGTASAALSQAAPARGLPKPGDVIEVQLYYNTPELRAYISGWKTAKIVVHVGSDGEMWYDWFGKIRPFPAADLWVYDWWYIGHSVNTP